jgi:hypothetical protein
MKIRFFLKKEVARLMEIPSMYIRLFTKRKIILPPIPIMWKLLLKK